MARWDEFTRIKRNLFLSFLSLFVVWIPLDSWLRVHPAYSFLSWTALIMLGAFGYYFQRYVHWRCPRCSHSFQQSTEWTLYGPWTVWETGSRATPLGQANLHRAAPFT